MTFAEIKRRLPPRTLGFLAAGAVIAVGFMVVFIIPDYHAAGELRSQIAQLQASVAVRRQLLPVAQSLKKAQDSLPAAGPVGGNAVLPVSEVGQLNTIFTDMITPLGLRVTRVSPEPSSVTKNGLLAVRLGLQGPPDAFREFLLRLGRYGPLVKLESVTTTVGSDGREYTLKCWLAIK